MGILERKVNTTYICGEMVIGKEVGGNVKV